MAEQKISPAVIIGGIVLGLVGVVGLATLAWAAPPEGEIYCPYDATHGPFATLDDVNIHIAEVHPGMPLIIHIVWE